MQYTESVAGEYAKYRGVVPELLKRLMAGSGIASTSHVLEIGCGTGNYLHAVSMTSGCCSTGVDPSDDMLAVARLQGLHVCQGRGETLPLADAMFDFVYSVDVIHHVVNREDFYSEAARVLRPGGWLCTATDSEWTIRNRGVLSNYFPDTITVDLQRYSSIPQIQAWMTQVGFQEIYEERIEWPYSSKNIDSYRNKAFSCLHLITEEAFALGLARLKVDFVRNPESFVEMVRYDLVWGTKGGEM